jgi:hypothetical protein
VIATQEVSELGSPLSGSSKRPHQEENADITGGTPSIVSDAEEQPSPLKRARRSMSSQESIDTSRYVVSVNRMESRMRSVCLNV